jgi:predicted metal-binding membrane protein
VKNIKIGWLLIAVAVLLVTLLGYDGTPNSDAEIFLFYSMAILGFPLSWFAGGSMAYALHLIDSRWHIGLSKTSYTELLIMWLSYASAGYYQWFYFVPPAFRKRQRRDPNT